MSIDFQAYTVYYKRLLPFKSLFAWLNHQHAPTRLFTHREWAFTVSGDVYLRWNSFDTVDDFKKEVLRLNPSRFEIGAVYTGKVGVLSQCCSYHHMGEFMYADYYVLYSTSKTFCLTMHITTSRKIRRLFARATSRPLSANSCSILI